MKVGIIGSGVVGQTLAAGFVKHGHQVEIGTRDPAKLKDWSAKNLGATVKSFAEAASFGDVVVLAVGGEVAQQALTLIGPTALQGKTVIDARPVMGTPKTCGDGMAVRPETSIDTVVSSSNQCDPCRLTS